jgi:hypothetical protein
VYERWVELAWDLTRVRFASLGSPEPLSGYFIDVVVDGEMAVVVGGEQARVHHPPINNMLEHELPMREYPRCVHRVVDGSAERGCIAGKSAWSPWAADVCSGCSGGKQQLSGSAEELPKSRVWAVVIGINNDGGSLAWSSAVGALETE